MKIIKLTQDKFAIIDDWNYELISKHKWFYEKTGYACRRKLGRSIRMHRFIMNAPENMEVDHINGNGLDNREENLRVCTHKENLRNAKLRKDNSNGYKGIYKNGKKWGARIIFNQKQINLGTYKTKEEAHIAYQAAASEYFGKFKRLN